MDGREVFYQHGPGAQLFTGVRTWAGAQSTELNCSPGREPRGIAGIDRCLAHIWPALAGELPRTRGWALRSGRTAAVCSVTKVKYFASSHGPPQQQGHKLSSF